MSAPFRIHDDNLIDDEVARILEAVIAAERRRLTLALQLANGATRYAFPRHDADSAINVAIGAVTGARYAMDRLISSRACGETYRPRPSPKAQMVELQARVGRNEAAANVTDLGPIIAATRRVDAIPDTAPFVTAAHARGAAILGGLPAYPVPPVADAHQLGFVSPAGA